jgi:hypothetical protein
MKLVGQDKYVSWVIAHNNPFECVRKLLLLKLAPHPDRAFANNGESTAKDMLYTSGFDVKIGR